MRQRELPAPPPPVARYTTLRESGRWAFVSGQGPVAPDGTLLIRGRLGGELTLGETESAARIAVGNVLAALNAGTGAGSRTAVVARLLIAVACAPEAGPELPAVGAAALAALAAHPGCGATPPACTVIGVPSLPLGIPVEIEALARLGHDAR